MIYLDVCCNDPQNGLFSYCAEALMVADMEFEPRSTGPSPRFRETETGIRLSGKNWRAEYSKYYVGNWCWNRYLLAERGKTPRWTMVEFLYWLRGRKLFAMHTGPSDLYEWFNCDHALAPVEVHTLICDLDGL